MYSCSVVPSTGFLASFVGDILASSMSLLVGVIGTRLRGLLTRSLLSACQTKGMHAVLVRRVCCYVNNEQTLANLCIASMSIQLASALSFVSLLLRGELAASRQNMYCTVLFSISGESLQPRITCFIAHSI